MNSVQYELVSGIMRYIFIVLIVYILVRVIQISLSDLSISKRRSGGRHYAKLICCDTPDEYFYGMDFGLKLENTIGSHRKCDIELPIDSVSKSHAVIYMKGKRFYVYDAGSAAGTYLNGKEIKRSVEILHDDVLYFGEMGFQVVLQEEQAVEQNLRDARAHEYGAERRSEGEFISPKR